MLALRRVPGLTFASQSRSGHAVANGEDPGFTWNARPPRDQRLSARDRGRCSQRGAGPSEHCRTDLPVTPGHESCVRRWRPSTRRFTWNASPLEAGARAPERTRSRSRSRSRTRTRTRTRKTLTHAMQVAVTPRSEPVGSSSVSRHHQGSERASPADSPRPSVGLWPRAIPGFGLACLARHPASAPVRRTILQTHVAWTRCLATQSPERRQRDPFSPARTPQTQAIAGRPSRTTGHGQPANRGREPIGGLRPASSLTGSVGPKRPRSQRSV